jgi:CDP-6-deoxy-D-xylo-4-hexulose-3-dehydrase
MNDKDLRVSYAHAVFGDEERAAVQKVLSTPQIVAGKHAVEFEMKIAGLFEKKYGLLVNSGSSANLMAIESLDLPEGAEVITPVLTFATTLSPILKRNLVPVFADADPRTYQINAEQVEGLIGKKTKAIMVPSLFGNIPDLPKLQKIAKKHKLYLIEDSCDTLGAKINGKSTGHYSDISTTSFYASHIITAAGEGGMTCFNDKELHDRARMLAGWGRRSALNETEDINVRYGTKLDGIEYDSKFIFSLIGYNLRTTDIVASFGLVQLKRLKKFQTIRQKAYRELSEFFSRYERFFILPEQKGNIETAWMAFPLTIKEGAPFTRREITTHLEQNNIQTRPVFTGNVLRQPAYKNIPRRERRGGYPVADAIMARGFVFACHHGLTAEHLKKMKRVFAEFLDRY